MYSSFDEYEGNPEIEALTEDAPTDFWGNDANENKIDLRKIFCVEDIEKCIALCFEIVDGTNSFGMGQTFQNNVQKARKYNGRYIQSLYLVMIFICRSYCGMCVPNVYE